MVAIKAGDVDRALRRVDPSVFVLLFYGPDAGLVAERARKAAEGAVLDPLDPFQLVRLDGDAVAAEPGRLSDEASTVGLFGEARSLWIKPTAKPLGPAVLALLEAPVKDTLVVFEAGDLAKAAPLRTLCERSPKALALPCYADSEGDLARVVDEALREGGLSIDRDARDLLIQSLGGDRLATRGELGKLTLYASGRASVTVDDVEAVVSDVSGAVLDAVLDAAFGGRAAVLTDACRRLAREGVAPSTVLTLALRHALLLAGARADVEGGRPPASVVEGWRGLSFKRRSAIERQLGQWNSTSLRRVVGRLQNAVLDTRRLPDLAEALTHRVLLQIGAQAANRQVQ